MTPRGEELARRLVGAKPALLREGMRDAPSGVRYRGHQDLDMGGNHICYGYKTDTGSMGSFHLFDFVPDLDDAPTWGALLAWLWELWPDAILEGSCDGGRFIENGSDQYHGPTPGEAIAAAILAALGDEG